jgi:ADP-ribose pyrophosphatase YjhB (NUDIX family)
MGGFVDVGESVEAAVRRELWEEMGVRLPDETEPVLFGVYSDPRRDNRRHTASVVFVVHLDKEIQPVAADDVSDVERISLDEIDRHSYFADHKTILTDFRSAWRGEPVSTNVGDFADDIARSLCAVKRGMFLKT